MRTIIHVNQHAIRRKEERCITVKQGKQNTYAGEVVIHGPSRVVHRPEKPLSCGAKVWIETEAPVEIINPGPPPEPKVQHERVKPKQGRERNEDHLDFIRRLPCTVCRIEGVDAAHIRYADLQRGKGITGMGRKPDDKWTLPLCRPCHREQHGMNERQYWHRHEIDALALAERLFEVSGDEEAARSILASV